MRFYRYPEKIVRILANAYKDTFVSVKVCIELNDQFKTIVGVLQRSSYHYSLIDSWN